MNKRVILFKNGSSTEGKVMLLPGSLEQLKQTASEKLGMKAVKFYTAHGAEIDEIELMRDDEVLFVSSGEEFIKTSQDKVELSTRQAKASSQIDNNNDSPSSHRSPSSSWIHLNVGGRIFTTTRSTLITKEPDSMLARMFADDYHDFVDRGISGCISMKPSPRDERGAYMIDRSPTYFEPILGYLRHGQLVLDKNINVQGVLEEAKFYGITSLIPVLEAIIAQEDCPTDPSVQPLTRRDVINALITTPNTSELRFQGVNMAHADLSRLDLRHINFKYANLRGARLQGANLSYCCLERADLSQCNLEGATLFGVKMVCCNLEGAVLRGTNMDDPLGNRTNMEGVNLKGANLEGSQLAGVNLRVATLKNANLQNCDLRGAVLAGADLENCDLSGSDLHEANLRGANLKGAAFELMLTPLHMAQAIR